ncbi:uncharacterized protein LOC111798884 [Cucurbita pepo subsp. pepo]|uniref:uncharacterized protein LOC111798884 n=1 Tax=Cucurbita pepo subsp. pepo TaxID=3664 RepID=UPI000C9D9D17|nr:uncharacterized protein LOC111798884 [Cucurbita pepo subsp. pepo]
MDTVFSLDEAHRATFLRAIMQSFHPTYICLWSYLPHPSHCLLNLDALFREEDANQPSSSLGSFERRLFDEYKQLVFNVENNLVPGHAFNNSISFLELHQSLLHIHSSSQIQSHFYAAAGIKSVVFMGCSNGEIELGFSEVNMVEKMRATSPFTSMAVLKNPPPPTWSSSSTNFLRRRPGSAQLLHMIAERRRREKLNGSFQALRSLLPPGTKKDKLSVLATTREYLTKLREQVSELSHKNQKLLEAQSQGEETANSFVNERFTVRVSHAPPSINGTEIIDLEITVRGQGSLMPDIVIRVLEFLKNVVNVGVILSFHGIEQLAPSSLLSRLRFRFSLQDGEWDELGFLEAVRRIVSDLAPTYNEKQP